MYHLKIAIGILAVSFFTYSPTLAKAKVEMDDDTVTQCKILKRKKRGKREPSGYVIKAFNPKGKKLDEYRAPDGGLFTHYDEAGLTLLTLVDNGDCPSGRRK